MHTPDSALRLLPMPMDEFAAHPTVPSCNDHGFVLRGESESHCRNVNFGLADMQLKNLNAQMVVRTRRVPTILCLRILLCSFLKCDFFLVDSSNFLGYLFVPRKGIFLLLF